MDKYTKLIAEAFPRKTRSKYRNKPVTINGIRFDSTKEAKRFQELQALEKAGNISDLKRQVKIPLIGQDQSPIRTEKGNPIRYVADFTYNENGHQIIEDTKGYKTDIYKLKKAILACQGYDIRES